MSKIHFSEAVGSIAMLLLALMAIPFVLLMRIIAEIAILINKKGGLNDYS